MNSSIWMGLIVSEWPNFERILFSRALKTTSQSMIVAKLSAYRHKNRTKRALWEFDNIIRSLYLLDLSEALADLEARGELASVEVLKRVSPIAAADAP